MTRRNKSLDGHGQTGSGVEVRLHGLEPGVCSQKSLRIDLRESVRLADLIAEVAARLDYPELARRIDEFHYDVLVNGANARHAAMWDTDVEPGAEVAIILPRAGG